MSLLAPIAQPSVGSLQAQQPLPASAGVQQVDTSRVGELAGVAREPLQAGDGVRVTFWRDDDLNGDYPVDERGEVVLPLIGRRIVTGLSTPELKTQLTAAYEEQLRNQDVQILFLRRVQVYGEVRKPGLYMVDATMTLTDALALAGGESPQGRRSDVRIRRGGIELRSDLTLDNALMTAVHSGDQIEIRKRNWFARNSMLLIPAFASAVAVVITRGLYY